MFRRALVTGGAGFIGSHLTRRLLAEGLEVTVVDDLSVGRAENVPPEARLVKGSILDAGLMGDLARKADVVFHEAARTTIRGSMDNYIADAETNLLGTLCVLRAASKGSVRKIVAASSMAVYADSEKPTPIDETHPAKPASPYGISKLASEMYLLNLGPHLGIDVVALRYFNTWGPGQAFTPYVGVITIFTNHLLGGEAPVIFGDGEQQRDFVWVGDIVEATVLAMNADVSGEVLNVGSGVATSVSRLAKLLAERINPSIVPRHAPPQPGELRNSVADIEKARRLLGYEPAGRLQTHIDEVIEHIRVTRGLAVT
jgi:UDP-glucose 4-epimerase